MPLIDMAEAASRGDIIVDEVDALNKYAERFVGGREQGVRGGERLPNLPMPSIIANNEGNSNSDRFNWNQVLVDEVDLVRAAENRRDVRMSVLIGSHQADVPGPAPNNNIVVEGGESAVWDRSLLVDEVDFLDAFEHGKISSDGSNIMRLSYDNRIRRPENDAIENQDGVRAAVTESDDDVVVDFDDEDDAVVNNDSVDEDENDGKDGGVDGDVSNHPIVNA